MKKNKAAAAFLTGALLTGMLSISSMAAQTGLGLELKLSGELKAGETVTAELWCQDNPGLSSVQFTLGFDQSVLDCVDCDTGEALRGMMSATNPDAKDGAIVAAASASDVERDGVLASYTFKVLKDGDCGFYLSNVVLQQSDGDKLSFQTTGLEHKVGGSSTGGSSTGSSSTGGSTSSGSGSSGGSSSGSAVAESTASGHKFTDIAGHWAADYLDIAGERGLIAGYPDGRCGPNDLVTRAQFVTILWQNAGKPAPKKTSTFTDLEKNVTYYHDAVAWAQENGYVAGTGDGKFNPNDSVSREQIAVILRQVAGGGSGEELLFAGTYDKHFTDSGKTSSWAKAAVNWALYNEVWCGRGQVAFGNVLSGPDAASRAEIAVMMVKYQDSMGG